MYILLRLSDAYWNMFEQPRVGAVIDFIHRCRLLTVAIVIDFTDLVAPVRPSLIPLDLPLVLCILSVRQFMSFVCHFWRSLSLATHTHTYTSIQSRIPRRAAHPSDVSTVTVVVFLGFLCPCPFSHSTLAVCLNGNCLPGRCWVLWPRQLFFSMLGDPSYPPTTPPKSLHTFQHLQRGILLKATIC